MAVDIPQTEERLSEYFGRDLRQVVCPICDATFLEVHDALVKTPAFDPASGSETGAFIFEVMVSCQNCSHTLRFDAVRLGALEKPDE